jgi:2-keto-4-pentenoate hydratase/2-oxohepta-3-ene-1,7-dioic acid hydratase in catechol pathway
MAGKSSVEPCGTAAFWSLGALATCSNLYAMGTPPSTACAPVSPLGTGRITRWNPSPSTPRVTLHAPVSRPSKVIGIGLNYIDHCREAGLDVPEYPVMFTKHSTSVSGPFDDVVCYRDICQELDYEVELGVVIGKPAFRISEADALEHVFGYTTVNDVSSRDLQLRAPGQWDLGKSLDTFCPYGPGIVTADEITDPQTLDLSLRVNGVEKQRSNTSNMIFGVAHLIAFLSRGITLLPGDLIATGTPFGVGLGMKPPVYLEDGDVCEAEVQGIGVIRNRVRMVG